MNDEDLVSRTRAAELLRRNGRTVSSALEGVRLQVGYALTIELL